ncbi:hypothetical protein ACH5RR_004816 [Cinchona calisaya]|uniref:HMA domain-containing protein n=1 Tax=Cinchona calisaya TaxID=153742 RepID=A0ABD3AYP3_9GENT
MKGIDIFCASQAATSIRLSMDDQGGSSSSSSSSSAIYLGGGGGGGGRAIDRYNPIIRDARRLGKSFPVPSCSSPHPPISPKPSSQNKNVGTTITKNSSSPPSREKSHNNKTNKKKMKIKNNKSSTTIIKQQQQQLPSDQEKRKSSGSGSSSITKPPANDPNNTSSRSSSFAYRKSWSCSSSAAAAGDFISPAVSSRYTLRDRAALLNLLSEDFDPLLKLLPPDNSNNNNAVQKDDESTSTCALRKPISTSSSRSHVPDQVVVLRVSLHCRGCERKMRKHISRMEGVSSFNIDFAAKKVTVVGNVTPLGVLASISKVKNAQLLTPAAIAVPSFTRINSSEIHKNSQSTLISS